jgi:hypothetical protein
MKSVCQILFGKRERKKLHGRQKPRCDDNIKMDLKEDTRRWNAFIWLRTGTVVVGLSLVKTVQLSKFSKLLQLTLPYGSDVGVSARRVWIYHAVVRTVKTLGPFCYFYSLSFAAPSIHSLFSELPHTIPAF